jgi:hypothetical protein
MKFMLVLGALIAAAWFYFKPLPPGEGPVAVSAMRASSGVLDAIESYRSARGMYPGTMEDMVPEYLGRVPRLKNGANLEYHRLGSNYQLTFNYTNPLPVHCTHDPKQTKRWACEWL